MHYNSCTYSIQTKREGKNSTYCWRFWQWKTNQISLFIFNHIFVLDIVEVAPEPILGTVGLIQDYALGDTQVHHKKPCTLILKPMDNLA